MSRRGGGLLVCGLPRSGTSLTRGLLAAHPSFAVPRNEMEWWVRLYPGFRAQPARWQAFLDALVADAKTATLDLDRDGLRRRLASVPRGAHHQAFACVLGAYAEVRRRPRWGEKTLFAEIYAEDVLRALPDLAVIHLVRDPRDMFASYRHAHWRTGPASRWTRAKQAVLGHLGWTVRNWRTSVGLARTLAARHPGRYRVVRYEDLVADPVRECERLCAFLGEPYDSRMLALDAYPDLIERRGNSSFGPLEGVSTAPVGRFRTVLDARTIALCEALAGEELARWGYARSGVALGRLESARLALVDRPASAVMALAHDAAFRVQGVPR
jgi:hypothetical protein